MIVGNLLRNYSADRRRIRLLGLFSRQCVSQRPPSKGTQRCNSASTLSLSQEWAVGYGENCGKRTFRLAELRAGMNFWPIGGRKSLTAMDSQTRDQAGCSLAAEALRSWGTLQLRATGISMLPTLWPGDLLTVRSVDPEQAGPGDIVLCMRQGRLFVHRMVAANFTQDDAFLITRGDCMPENDPPVARRDVLGKITEVRRAGSVFAPARTTSLFLRPMAWMLCHWSFFRRVALRLWKYRRVPPCSSVSSVVQGFSPPASARNGVATN